jgi:hypothetical protein
MTPQQRDATIQHFSKSSLISSCVWLTNSEKYRSHSLPYLSQSRWCCPQLDRGFNGVYDGFLGRQLFSLHADQADEKWNPSVEYQAMDRIHRLGQKRPVTVVKLVIEDSIEDQIVQLQAKKLAMTEAALSTDPDQALGKLTIEDLGFLFKL